ncbi:MAG TPA: YdcF family protein [Alphaproteobacteria bacterium]
MFAASKIAWFIANPQTLAFLLLALGTALLFTKAWRRGRTVIAAVLGLAVITIVLPVGRWSVQALEHRFPQPTLPAQVDGIILIGGEIDQEPSLAYGQPIFVNGAGRLLAFADLARRYPGAKLVFTGGSGRLLNQGQTESEAMPMALRAVGLDPARVIFEDRSRNTHENAVFTRDLMKPMAGQAWVMVTSALHVPRAVGCFRQAGFPVIPYPADYQTLPTGDRLFDKPIGFDLGYGTLTAAVREFIGLIAYRAAGYTDALFPAP